MHTMLIHAEPMILHTETMLQTGATSTSESPTDSETVKLPLNSDHEQEKIFDDTCSSSSSSSSLDTSESTKTYVSLEESARGPLLATTTTATTISPPRSILKSHTKGEPRYVKPGKRIWNVLPPLVDIRKLPAHSACTSTSASSSINNNTTNTTRKSVEFDSVMIRSYQQTMGDNPSVSYGPPIQLDWEYEEHDDLPIDEYESQRVLSRRTHRQLPISHYRRMAVLSRGYGFSEGELHKAMKAADKTKFLRGVTNMMLPTMKVQAALESARRKTKRVFVRRGKE